MEEILIPKRWHHSLTGVTIVTEPLGKTAGTVLEVSFIYSSLIALAREIASKNNENLDQFSMLADSLTARANSESATITHHEIIGIAYDATLGYSARMSAASKKFTILFGEPHAVARASTPFHSSIADAVANAEVASGNLESFVLSIDGIAYAALVLFSEYK